MTRFRELVGAAASDHIGPMVKEASTRDFMLDSGRATEADAVEPCVDRFAQYELFPPEVGRGVGRCSPVGMTPALGALLGKKARGLDDEQTEAVHDAIASGVAVGYIGVAGLEPGEDS